MNIAHLVLSLHTFSTLFAVIFLYALLLTLLKKEPELLRAKTISFLAFFLAVFSFFSRRLSTDVFPIQPGNFGGNNEAWIRALVESNETFFFLLPLLTFLLVVLFAFGKGEAISNLRYRRRITTLAVISFALALSLVLSGIVALGI